MGGVTISDDLLNDVERILIVTSIIATVLANVFYLHRCRRVSEILSKPVFCSRIFLALGCILLALFPYIVMARRFFSTMDDYVKVTSLTSKLFLFSFFPFVFGCGLLLQGICLMSDVTAYSQWTRCHVGPQIRSVLIAISPWFLGLVLMFLLANLSDEFDWDEVCFGTTRSSIFMIIRIFCTILPAVAACLCSIVLIRRASRGLHARAKDTDTSSPLVMASAPAPPQPTPQPRVIPATSPFYPMQTYTEQYPQLEPPHSPPMYSQQPQLFPPQSPPEYAQLYPQLHRQPQPPQQYPPQVHSQQYLQMYSQQYPQQYTTPPNAQSQAPVPQPPPSTPTPATPSDEPEATRKAKVTLLLSSIVFAISILPVSSFWLSFSCGCLHDWEKDEMVILHSSVFWVVFLYPLVVPVLWLRDITA